MTVTAVRKDPQRLTLTVEAEFAASVERIWQLWADPRQLERWWGPPTYPATFTKHDLAPGGRVESHMTGPAGDQPHGYWEILQADAPHQLVFLDGFSNADGTHNTDLPLNTMTLRVVEVGRAHAHVDRDRVPQHRGHGAGPGHGHGRGTEPGRRPDRCHPRRGRCGGQRQRRRSVTTTTQPTTHTLDVPGATLAYDVRRNATTTEPILLLIGSPMGAAGFGTLAGHFADRTVVTYDPRGADRSQKTDPASPSTPEEHADDLDRLIQALDAGPVDLFASSGGAVNALALVERHPEQVRTLVAHEPPLLQVLPDREAALAAARDIHDTYMRSGFGAGMAKFIALVQHRGPVPADWVDRPDPDPAYVWSADRRRRLAQRPAAGAEHDLGHPVRA